MRLWVPRRAPCGRIWGVRNALLAFAAAAAVSVAGAPASAAEVACTILPETLEQGASDVAPPSSVAQLQAFLQAKGYLSGDTVISGYYGTSTAAAVSAFQAEHAILRTSIAGPITRLRIQTVSCPVAPLPPEPTAPVVYNPALPPPFVKAPGLNQIKITYKRGSKTDDGFTKYRMNFGDREENLKISWWVVRAYCENAVVRFGEDLALGCGEETPRLSSSKTRKGAVRDFRLDGVADGRSRGRGTVRAWAYDADGRIVGENRVYFWVH